MYNLWGKPCWALSLHRYSDIWKDHIMHEIRTGIPDVQLYLLALQVTWVNKRLTSTLPYIVDLQTCIWKWHNYRKLCAALRCEFAAETRSCMSLCRCDFFLNIYHWASSEVSGMWEETKYTAELTVLLHLIANTDAVIDPFAGHLCTAFSCCLIHHKSPHTTLRPSKGFLVVLACCCCSSALMRFLWWSGWFTLTCDNSRYFFFF